MTKKRYASSESKRGLLILTDSPNRFETEAIQTLLFENGLNFDVRVLGCAPDCESNFTKGAGFVIIDLDNRLESYNCTEYVLKQGKSVLVFSDLFKLNKIFHLYGRPKWDCSKKANILAVILSFIKEAIEIEKRKR